jgi:hypothetical protein
MKYDYLFTYRLPFFQKPKENGLSAVTVGDWDSCFFYKGEKVRIVNFAGHFVVQSLYSGRVTKAFKHELCIGEPVNEDPEWADTDFLNPSQSDEELSCIVEPGTHDKLRPHLKCF